MNYLKSLYNRLAKFEVRLTTEEKILCLIPVIGAYIDIFVTFWIAGEPSVLLLLEMNALLKSSLISNFAVFYYMVLVPFTILILFTCLISVSKLSKHSHELQYAISFAYFGYRIAGGSTWLLHLMN